jgi:arylsulfatase A-like enzyme
MVQVTAEKQVDNARNGESAAMSSAIGPSSALPLVLLGGVFYGGLEAVLDPGVLGLRAHFQAALLSGAPALVLGAFAWAALAALGRSSGALVALQWLRRATSRDPASERAPVLQLHAVLIVGVVILTLWAWLSERVFRALFAVQEEELAIALAVAVSTVMLVGGIAAIFVGAPLIRHPLAWVDRRWRLPLPPAALARYFLYVALPAFLILTALSRAYGDLLGIVGQLIAVPLVLAMAGLVWQVACIRPLPARRQTALGVSLITVWGLALTLGGALRDPVHGVGDRSLSPAAALGATLTRSLAWSAPAAPAFVARSDGAAASVTSEVPFFTAEGSPSQRYDVVWIIVDALRADKLGAVRGGQPLTPNLDRLARESVVFSRAYSQASSTTYSVPSMLTGRNVEAIDWQWARNRPQLPVSELTLAERLVAHGYQTAFVLSPFMEGSLKGSHQGYTTRAVVKGLKKTRRAWLTRMSPIATARAIATVGDLAPAARPSRPFFLTVYYAEPHAPYVRHAEFGERFPETSVGSYEADVAFADLHLGQLLEHLRLRAPLWENTIVVVTADHGEEFGEHGSRRHGHGCHVEAVHVPLLLRIPGVAPAQIATPVALVDIVPTLIELVGAPRGGPALSGRSLLEPIRDPGQVDEERPIFSTTAQQRADRGPLLVRAVRQAGYTLIHTRESQAWAFFQMEEDPTEQHDLSEEPAHAARARSMRELLENNHTGNVGQPPPQRNVEPR